jgi:hypothetical protein
MRLAFMDRTPIFYHELDFSSIGKVYSDYNFFLVR